MKNNWNINTLELAIILTILAENIAKSKYYERVNPIVATQDNQPVMEHSERLENLRQKLKTWIPGDKLVDFIVHNPHLSELWPDIKIDDEIAKRLEEDNNDYATVQGE